MSLQIEEFQGKFCDYYSADYDLEECGKLTSQNQCKTLEGTLCVFPFMFRGLEVTECISGSPRTLPWCATQIDSYGEIVGSQWRNCDKQSCPTDIIRSPFGKLIRYQSTVAWFDIFFIGSNDETCLVDHEKAINSCL